MTNALWNEPPNCSTFAQPPKGLDGQFTQLAPSVKMSWVVPTESVKSISTAQTTTVSFVDTLNGGSTGIIKKESSIPPDV